MRPGIVEEFRWFCGVRRSLAQESPLSTTPLDAARYTTARRAFGGPRFYAVYRSWLREGERAFQELLSPLLHDASRRGDARVETYVAPYRYLRLASSVGTA